MPFLQLIIFSLDHLLSCIIAKMWELLPKELWVDICLRLPIKSLVICACTCKTMLTFLTSSDFTTAHNKKCKDNPFIFLRYFDKYTEGSYSDTKEYFALHPDDNKFSASNIVFRELPIKDRLFYCYGIVGSCNGVVCLSDVLSCSNIVYLWNPCIRKSIKLPDSIYTRASCGMFEECFGFGFDEVTNDYKVVRLVYPYDVSEPEPPRIPPLVEVYSLKSGSWRSITSSLPMYYVLQETWGGTPGNWCYSQCFLNGYVHWPGFAIETQRCLEVDVWRIIITFNVHEECFGEMKFPACLEGSESYSNRLKVTTCWDMLALIVTDSRLEDRFVMWVMKEYGNVDSWTQAFRYTNPNGHPLPKAWYFRKNKDVLLLVRGCCYRLNSKNFHRLLSVDCDRDQKEFLGNLEGERKIFYLESYNEGLALFNEGKVVSNDEVEDEIAPEGMPKKPPCECDFPEVVSNMKLERLL